jgi:hypothetical protein
MAKPDNVVAVTAALLDKRRWLLIAPADVDSEQSLKLKWDVRGMVSSSSSRRDHIN